MSDFQKKVYQACQKIPKGKISTYKKVATAAGRPFAFRAVGSLLHRNKDKKVPCHRVVKSNGLVGGFREGIRKKIDKLRKEGVDIKSGRVTNFKKRIFSF